MRNFLSVILFSVLSLHPLCLAAQSADNPSSEYLNTTGSNAVLFNGKAQSLLPGNVESLYLRERGDVQRDTWGHERIPDRVPTSMSYSRGNITYNDVEYFKVWMRLDLYRDEIAVLESSESPFGIVLSPEHFGKAYLRGYSIIHIPESSPQFNLPKGYYLRLGEDNTSTDLLKKEHLALDPINKQFRDRVVRYYVRTDGVYHTFTKQSQLLKLLKSHKRELRRFIRDRRLNMKLDSENTVIQVVNEYERLTR